MGASSVLIIPAAGLGSRLDVRTPKLLVKVGGKAMVDWLLDLYDGAVDRFILVLHPSFEAEVREHCQDRWRLGYARQEHPTGMLDAILAPIAAARLGDPERIWITWCDQVAIHPATIQQLKELSAQPAAAPLILPTATRQAPYIHIVRDRQGRIVDIRHRREGDQMPQVGESDAGLFSLSSDTYFNHLVEFARQAEPATGTRERNFLPFIAWLSHQGPSVHTFPCRDDEEAIGINTPDDLRTIERYLSMRDGIAGPLT
jgi:bifunctional UDP-N-acetylglucosamine pyrophosphorylase/glucosamine-1-phosphate N-acetyltransferase